MGYEGGPHHDLFVALGQQREPQRQGQLVRPLVLLQGLRLQGELVGEGQALQLILR